MRLNVSAWSIRRPIPAIVFFGVLALLGWSAFKNLAIERFPNIDIPIIAVTITQSGAAPAELETQVTKKVEDAVASLNGIWHIISTVTDGVSTTVINFNVGSVDIDRALNDVKDKISAIRGDLPRSINEPLINRVDVDGPPFVTYAAYAPGLTAEQLSWYVDDTVARELQGVKGVGSVSRAGGVDREIRVSLDPQKLLALGVTAAAVNQQVQANNIDVGGGRGQIAGQEQAIRTLAGARSVGELAALTIALPGGRKVRLDELGKVEDSSAEQRTYARLDDKPIVAFGIVRAKGASAVVVDDLVAKALDKLHVAHPDVEFTKVDTQVDNIVGNYKSTMETLIEGALLAVLVVALFLRDWRATLVTAMALPLSIIPTFFMMKFLGFSLNLVSLLAITIVTGILVDDAIVEIENIVRHMRMGKSAYRASLEAADEIGLAVIAISCTIMAIFAPVSFMGGIPGQYFKQFGLTIALAVLFSLLTARFITPVATAYFLRGGDEPTHRDGFVMRSYLWFVAKTARHYILTFICGILIFAGSIYMAKYLHFNFIPADDQSRIELAVELPPGSLLSDTDAVTRTVARRLHERKEVKSVLIYGGQIVQGAFGGGSAEPRKATFVINLINKTKRDLTQKEMQTQIAGMINDIPDIRFWFLKDNGQRDVQLIVAGPNDETINAVANQLASEMKRIPIIENPISTAELDRPELRIEPRRQVAADLGVSAQTLSDTIRVATLGDIDANLAKFDAGSRQVPIRVELDESARRNAGVLQDLRVPRASGDSAPLSVLADFSIGHGPTVINRNDRTRKVTVEGDLRGDSALGDATTAIRALPTAKKLPPGVEILDTGDAEVQTQINDGFMTAMGAGLMMVYGLLVLLFGSFLLPVTILVSLPLSIGGAIGALILTNTPVSLPVILGILMLMGIVTKNAIMLVDFAVEEMARRPSRTEAQWNADRKAAESIILRRAAQWREYVPISLYFFPAFVRFKIDEMTRTIPRRQALVEAGHKRARPIIMTTIAMAAGMFPAALGLGEGGGFRAPMAIAVIGGLLVSTVLSLVFVPAAFTLFDNIGRGIWWVFGRFVGSSDEPDASAEIPSAASPAPSMKIAAE